MWLWILSGLFVCLVWAVWFILRPTGPGPGVETFPTWMPVVITLAVVLLLVGLVVFRKVRARRAARALEKAIAQQAQEQALSAKPEDRAQIQALHKQILDGINALKASKLGGNASGSDALYSLPWYAMVGPPGAGKTTALRHSGLVFPYLDPNGGGVAGVGGTRNCDWWFTNEAILLDTAGRYTTEEADHDEWIAFLEQLLKYRSKKPLNGVVVALGVSDLLDATDDQIDQMGRKVRARIDEMQETLKMSLPVYVIFTKSDLVGGFAEFFGDLKKSERSQAWGATIPLDKDKSAPKAIFDEEFDILVERLHHRSLQRLATERNRDAKEKIYQFPLEFAAIKQNLSDFIAAAFAPDPKAPTPLFRGFYFTSGVQEGKPLDRVVGAMARVFGLRGAADDAAAAKTESKSFFLRDVFTGVVFPDQDLAGRTEGEVRRLRLQRFAVAAAAAALALVLIIPAIFSYFKNRELVADTADISQQAAGLVWTDGKPVGAKVESLDRLRAQAELLDQYKQDGPPMGYRWAMYQGDTLFEPTLEQYLANLKEGFLKPVQASLSNKLRGVTGEDFLKDYTTLKTYLLLNDPHIIDPETAEWETSQLTQAWADVVRPTSELPEADLKAKLRPHAAYYVDLLRRNAIEKPVTEKALIESARAILTRVGPSQRYYNQFVTSLIGQKYDESGPDTPENLKYPPISLKTMFSDRPEILSVMKSKIGKQVEGPYSIKGHQQVLASLEEGYKNLERETWVVPLTSEEKLQGDKIKQALDRVRQDYDAEYIKQWAEFFRDIDVAIPANNKQAIAEFKVLATPDWPYLRLLRALADNTQFQSDAANEALDAASAEGGIIDQIKQKVERKVDSKAKMRVSDVLLSAAAGKGPDGKRYDPIPDKFKSMVQFGVPAGPAKEGEPPPPPPALATYIGHLEQLSGQMGTIEDGPPSTSTAAVTGKFEEAVAQTESLLLKLDPTGQELMTPLLMNPLKLAYRAMMKGAGGTASGLWELDVWPTYRDKIKDRYPFNTAAARDASFEDAVGFFKPQTGVLWGFYDQHLKTFMYKTGHDYYPSAHLEPRNRPTQAFTPFNANLYNCLRRADEISDALFPGGAEKPNVEFKINLKTVSPIVSEVLFEIDGQKKLYRNEKEYWQSFTWPGDKPTGAKLQVRGAGGLDEELTREGPWGLFRLFEAGTYDAQKDSDEVFTVTWQLTAPPVTVTMEVRPTRGSQPFPMSFFRATNCPASIGDSFGKGS